MRMRRRPGPPPASTAPSVRPAPPPPNSLPPAAPLRSHGRPVTPANELSVDAAAADPDTPAAQIRETAVYYRLHRDEVDGEMAEEDRPLLEQGAALGAEDPPG